jgi:DNA topoisomerase-1
MDALRLKDAKRITFTSITESAIRDAIRKPRSIDMNLVAAQEARRVLDRLCGYQVSGPLSDAANAGVRLSAGRVQSVAVRLVVERKFDIQNFQPTPYFVVELRFEGGWNAVWETKGWLPEGQKYFQDKAVVEAVAQTRDLEVADCKESESRSSPPAPFTTSTLQQAGSTVCKFSTKKTMELAQRLYEQGHITYMRTDSPTLSEEAAEEVRAFCRKQGWPLAPQIRTWKSKEGAQEAHEAIRPTHMEVETAGEDDDQKALYGLIRLRVLACQLEDAVFAVRALRLKGALHGKDLYFVARGEAMVSPGWQQVMGKDRTEEQTPEQDMDNPVPAMQVGEMLTSLGGNVLFKKTSPPPLFDEAGLVKELEKRGIGRPSTFASILDTIVRVREYVKIDEKRKLVPTQLGEMVVSHLHGNFDFLDYEFTRTVEDALDAIAEGQTTYQAVVAANFAQLQEQLDVFKQKKARPGLECPECRKPNLRRVFKKATPGNPKAYDFFSCPDCETTFANVNGQPVKREKKTFPLSEFKCGKCGKPLVRLTGVSSKTGKQYDFYGCFDSRCTQKYRTQPDGAPNFSS